MAYTPIYGTSPNEQLSSALLDSEVRVDDFGSVEELPDKATATDLGGVTVRRFLTYKSDYGRVVQ